MMALVLSTITTGFFAQGRQQANSATAEQKEQMKEVKEKYSPELTELRNELRLVSTEQRVLLSSKEINEKAIYANIDKMGQLKTDMHKQTLAMHGEMKTICPAAGKKHGAKQGQQMKGERKGAKMGEGKTPQRGHQAQAQNSQRPQKGQQNKGMKQGAKQGNEGQSNCTQGPRKGENSRLKLDIEQTEQIAEIKAAHFWKIQETQNQIALLKAKNTSPEAQLASIDDISSLQTQLAKQRMAVKLETLKVLTEEQRMQMIAMHQGKKGHGQDKGHNRTRGHKKGQGERMHKERI